MKKNIYNPNDIFFTSDTHYYHKSVIEYCNRPFKSLEEMHETMINNWNKKVNKNQLVFILGDFIFSGSSILLEELLNKLNGDKILIFGNHCIKNRLNRESFKKYFLETHDHLEIYVQDSDFEFNIQTIFLSHYPCMVWPKSGQNSFHTFGHVHTRPFNTGDDKILMDYYYSLKLKSYDVGVDNNNFTPISYFELKNKLID